jgi:hypothetical protein
VAFGGLIYIYLRPYHLENQLFPDWMVYSLPNGLWAFAYALIITRIWGRNKSWPRIIWLASIPALVLGFETLQFWGIVHGTFCLQDLALGLTGIILGIITVFIIPKPHPHEKSK